MGNQDPAAGTGRYRFSAWLPPGLALAWLPVLAIFVHVAWQLLVTWAGTVCAVLLIAMLVLRLSAGRDSKVQQSRIEPEPSQNAGIAELAAAASAAVPVTAPSAHPAPLPPTPAPGAVPPSAPLLAPTVAGVDVMTAPEVAELLRVNTDELTAAIGSGEFPGNRLGAHWRVDGAAVVRWLQGSYRQPPDPGSGPGSP